MTLGFALEYIPRRMCELGYGPDYTIKFRHLVMQPKETRVLNLYDNILLLVESFCDIRVESSIGVFDLSEDMTNELQYEHKGDVAVSNLSIFTNHVKFIQVIPQNCKTPCQ